MQLKPETFALLIGVVLGVTGYRLWSAPSSDELALAETSKAFASECAKIKECTARAFGHRNYMEMRLEACFRPSNKVAEEFDCTPPIIAAAERYAKDAERRSDQELRLMLKEIEELEPARKVTRN